MSEATTRNIHRNSEVQLEEELAKVHEGLFRNESWIEELAMEPGGPESDRMDQLKMENIGFHMMIDITQIGIRHALERIAKARKSSKEA